MLGLTSSLLVLTRFVFAAGREGEDFLLELADEVLGNPQRILEVPWEIFKDTPSYRDVGYVGEHPIASAYATEIKLASLGTQREIDGFPPGIVIGRALTKEKQLPTSPRGDNRWTGLGAAEIRRLNGMVNPSHEMTLWQWQRLRWGAAKEFLEYWAGRSRGNKLAVLHSSGDVLYGGCDENTITYKYNQIVSASGGTQKIVVAGELSPFPAALGWNYENTAWVETARSSQLSGLSVPASWVSGYADCTNATLGPCTSPPKYQFANSGVIVGQLDAIIEMVSELATTYTGTDNRLVNEYFLKNPDKVAVDYGGILSMSLHNMGATLPVYVASDKTIKSRVNDNAVCFVHGNGNSFAALKGLAAELKA